jgi:hypothetical protein
VLLRVAQPSTALAFLSALPLPWEGSHTPENGLWTQVALSLSGLRALGAPKVRAPASPGGPLRGSGLVRRAVAEFFVGWGELANPNSAVCTTRWGSLCSPLTYRLKRIQRDELKLWFSASSRQRPSENSLVLGQL